MDQRHRRRLSTICSHLHPHCPFPHQRPGSLHPSAVSSDNRAQDKPCVFCSISRGESEAFKLYEDDMCVCILDSNPLTHGHSLIITKSHYPSLDATPALVVAAMCSKVPFLSNAIMKATQSDSFNLLVNSGSAAGQVIFHTHFHIIPRKSGDKLWPSENSRRRPLIYNQNTVVLVDCIKGQLYSSPSDDSCCSCESILTKNC
ncbi:uncharacterized protein A4U43_C02F10280 [Asparagus officinalis]|uniref:HIT domain-containing protein n=1 Tax=Asparagus officinalis TaxID=4686 RepID=A0A5P1FJ76_ASPOF|nr:adenylylsulfatase HINT3 isoform X2 [Asparagus officinalis]ONK77763.1 uncharacterized protein A4U43_C02F10280 [Asparagus officinalis]